MTYRDLFYKATRLCDEGEITLGEYEEMTKPLDREVEQEPIEVEAAKLQKAYNKGYADGQKALAEHIRLCKEKQEPTTKNDLGVDCIDKNKAYEIIESWAETFDNGAYFDNEQVQEIIMVCANRIDELPSVTPQESKTEWIPVSEMLPKEHMCNDGCVEPSDYVLVQMKSGLMYVSRYWDRYDDSWIDLHYPTTDIVIAWMPLPKPYKENE